MADSLHNTLAAFRDSILQSIARLEFQMRDNMTTLRGASNSQFEVNGEYYHRINAIEQSNEQDRQMFKQMIAEQEAKINTIIQSLHSRIESLEHKLSVPIKTQSSESMEEILVIEEPVPTRNIIIPSVRSTPALTAAIAAAIPEPVVLNSESESEHSGEVIEEISEDEEDSGPELIKVIIKGVSYYMDSSNTVYQETEDGYEEVGTYNPKLDRIEVAQEEEESEEEIEAEEEEEEAIETEEFTYKGQTYQRDAEGNVYDDEGDVIGFWNGKKIVAAIA